MKRRLTTCIMILSLIFVHVVPVQAKTTETTIYVNIASTYSVNVPKKLQLSGKSTDFSINVTGNIAANQRIRVAPSSSTIVMTNTQNSKSKLNVSVKQSAANQVFTFDEIQNEGGKTKTGTIVIDTENIQAGEYKGTINFNINLETIE